MSSSDRPSGGTYGGRENAASLVCRLEKLFSISTLSDEYLGLSFDLYVWNSLNRAMAPSKL